MSTYKITNISNLANKRGFKYNSTIDIDYIDNMTKKTIKIKPGDTIFLTLQTSSLPLSIHRWRVKKLITVVEISNTELNNSINSVKPKPKIVEEEKKPLILNKKKDSDKKTKNK